MIPVDQTSFGVPNGNCFSACIASILHMPIADVPSFCKHEDWWERLTAWLQPHGYYPTIIRHNPEWTPQGFHVLSGKSPRGDFQHSVVALGPDIIHDPHPSRLGIEDRRDIVLLVPIDHFEFVRHDVETLYIFDADATLRRCTIKGQPCPNRHGEWMPITWAKERLAQIDWRRNGFGIASNQAGVALGFIEPDVCVQMLNELAVKMTGRWPNPKAIRVCPHLPTANCDCRKPKPQMLHDIRDEFGVANSQVVYVGDMESDKYAADAAHVAFQWAWEFCGKTREEWAAMLGDA